MGKRNRREEEESEEEEELDVRTTPDVSPALGQGKARARGAAIGDRFSVVGPSAPSGRGGGCPLERKLSVKIHIENSQRLPQEIDDDEAEEEAAALERIRSKNPNAPQGRPAVHNDAVRDTSPSRFGAPPCRSIGLLTAAVGGDQPRLRSPCPCAPR